MYTLLHRLTAANMRLCLVWFILMVISWTRWEILQLKERKLCAVSQRIEHTFSKKIFCVLMIMLKRKIINFLKGLQITHFLLYWEKWIFSSVIWHGCIIYVLLMLILSKKMEVTMLYIALSIMAMSHFNFYWCKRCLPGRNSNKISLYLEQK